MNVEALQTKYPIIDWEVYTEDSRMYWKIIKVGNHTEVYHIFEDMLKIFDRDDLVELWSLVHERFNSTEPTEDKERALWVELKRLFEPVNDDELWKSQRYMHDPLTWRLYDTCGIHHVSTEREHDIFMVVEKDSLTKRLMTLMLCNKLQVDQHSEMADELLRKIFILLGSTLSTLHDENMLLKHQVESTIKERENIKLEFQKLVNSIKATRAQHQNEINEIFEDVTQKTYAYADVHAHNQDLLMTISELKSKLKTINKGKHVNTKFEKSKTLGQLLCVTPFNKNIAIKAKNVSNTKVTSDRLKPVTS
ncbi:hypothetical protein Tco_0930933 [Tanacetum coccineum]